MARSFMDDNATVHKEKASLFGVRPCTVSSLPDVRESSMLVGPAEGRQRRGPVVRPGRPSAARCALALVVAAAGRSEPGGSYDVPEATTWSDQDGRCR
jgi:hypothetical protein